MVFTTRSLDSFASRRSRPGSNNDVLRIISQQANDSEQANDRCSPSTRKDGSMTAPTDASQFLLAEYGELRGEILKRSEFQHQLVSIALVAFGTLAAIGLKDSPIALLAYPLLVLFLSTAWSYHGLQIAQLGIYIRYRIEGQLVPAEIGWEHARLSDLASKQIGALIRVATHGLLLGSECLAIGLYLLVRLSIGWPTRFEEYSVDIVLIVLASIATVSTAWVLRDRAGLVREVRKSMKRPAIESSAESEPSVGEDER